MNSSSIIAQHLNHISIVAVLCLAMLCQSSPGALGSVAPGPARNQPFPPFAAVAAASVDSVLNRLPPVTPGHLLMSLDQLNGYRRMMDDDHSFFAASIRDETDHQISSDESEAEEAVEHGRFFRVVPDIRDLVRCRVPRLQSVVASSPPGPYLYLDAVSSWLNFQAKGVALSRWSGGGSGGGSVVGRRGFLPTPIVQKCMGFLPRREGPREPEKEPPESDEGAGVPEDAAPAEASGRGGGEFPVRLGLWEVWLGVIYWVAQADALGVLPGELFPEESGPAGLRPLLLSRRCDIDNCNRMVDLGLNGGMHLQNGPHTGRFCSDCVCRARRNCPICGDPCPQPGLLCAEHVQQNGLLPKMPRSVWLLNKLIFGLQTWNTPQKPQNWVLDVGVPILRGLDPGVGRASSPVPPSLGLTERETAEVLYDATVARARRDLQVHIREAFAVEGCAPMRVKARHSRRGARSVEVERYLERVARLSEAREE